MRKIIIAALLVSMLVLGCASKETPPVSRYEGKNIYTDDVSPYKDLVGADEDEHGCKVSAGYQWCESKEKCVRAWIEYCPELADQFNEDLINDFEECAAAGLPIMESYPRQCRAGETTFVEELENQGQLEVIFE